MRRVVPWAILPGFLAAVAWVRGPSRDPAAGRAVAALEIGAALDAGERRRQRVDVVRSGWRTGYRDRPGVLVATDRRLMLAEPVEQGIRLAGAPPPDVALWSLPYEAPLELRRVGAGDALLAGAGRRERLAIVRGQARSLDALLAEVSAAVGQRQARLDAEQRAASATVAAARRPVYHLVQRGESLEGIARRYGVPPDSLRAWNALPSPRIAAGARLLVRPGTS